MMCSGRFRVSVFGRPGAGGLFDSRADRQRAASPSPDDWPRRVLLVHLRPPGPGQVEQALANLAPINKPRYSVQQVIDAVRQANGVLTAAARILGCERQTVQNYANRHPSIKEAICQEREGMVDLAEAALRRAVEQGEAWATCFTLKCLGKDRGYVERQEHTGKDGGPIVFSESAEAFDRRMAHLASAATKRGIREEPDGEGQGQA